MHENWNTQSQRQNQKIRLKSARMFAKHVLIDIIYFDIFTHRFPSQYDILPFILRSRPFVSRTTRIYNEQHIRIKQNKYS